MKQRKKSIDQKEKSTSHSLSKVNNVFIAFTGLILDQTTRDVVISTINMISKQQQSLYSEKEKSQQKWFWETLKAMMKCLKK